jgi:nucleoside-diphosphate-sugar epimerase
MSVMLVTGGAGFIGSHLAHRLIDLGHDVRVLDNFSTGRRENIAPVLGRIELIEADVRDLAVVRKAVSGVDVVFHEAALASVPRSVDDPVTSNEVNVVGTLNVLEASRDAGVSRVVYASSSSVYGDSRELPKLEQMPPAPESPYAVGKLAGEHYCRVFSRLYGLDCVALRYFNVFGPRQDPSSQYAAVVPIFITSLLDGSTPIIHGDGEQSRDFTFIDNVVAANILAAEAPLCAGEVMNIACGKTATVNALFGALREIVGSAVQARHVDPRPGDVKHSFADISKARRLLGFSPSVGFEEGLKRTVSWFRDGARLG